ncbi:MAG: hypothetical protein JNG89_20780 [Planctomycetaceae bacterium]|nr:hypothetical protein [Planctomycetaceae bacterium]
MNARFPFLCQAAVALLGLISLGNVRAEEPRVVVVVQSAESLLGDLEHMVADLAGRREDWDNSVFPNIDIFLIGVDKTQPVRYDQIMGAAGGRREQLMVPIDNLDDFINGNLDPLGIVVKQERRQKDLYKLSDVYEGWMRIKENYARLAVKDHPEDVPADMPHPSATHAELLALGYDVAAQLDNSKTTAEQRQAAFAAFRDNTLAGIQQRPDETQEQFQLRQTNTQQSMATMERLFVESSLVTIGWTTDADKGVGKLVLAAVPETPLATTLKLQGTKASRFAGVAKPEDPVLAGRLNYVLDELAIGQFGELYKLSRPAMEQRIDKTEGLTDEQKKARKEIAGVVLDMLTSSLELGKWDGAVQLTTQPSGLHTGVLGICAKDGAPVAQIMELLPAANGRYATQLNVDETGDVKIHKLTVTEGYPAALKAFFGDAPDVYVGTGPDTIWVSVGEGAVDALKAAVAAAAAPPAGEVDPTVASLDLDLLPVLQLMSQLRKDGDFDLMGMLQSRGMIEEPPAATEGEEEKPGADTARMLKDFEWRDAAIEALDSQADRLHMELKRVDDRLEGETTVEKGILKAIGEVIAKFARENLG